MFKIPLRLPLKCQDEISFFISHIRHDFCGPRGGIFKL